MPPSVACPYFMPVERIGENLWPFPRRLPLGGGWSGHCTALGHEGFRPAPEHLRDCCNLGYAGDCPRLPAERDADAVRFAVVCDRDGSIQLGFVAERAHLPRAHGMLTYDLTAAAWPQPHPDARIQRMAECFLESYLMRRR